MPTTPTIQYLQLDASYDPLFDPHSNLTDLEAVTQAILTRLKLFLGEWWADTNIGLPAFQSILGQLGSRQGIAAMSLAIQRNIEGGPYVTGVTDVSVSFADGRLTVTGRALTQFGPVVINNAPAFASASLVVSK